MAVFETSEPWMRSACILGGIESVLNSAELRSAGSLNRAVTLSQLQLRTRTTPIMVATAHWRYSDIHSGEAADVGEAIDLAKFRDAVGEVAGGDEAVEFDEDGPVDDLAEPSQHFRRQRSARFGG